MAKTGTRSVSEANGTWPTEFGGFARQHNGIE
jgi:hypothetical protein